MEPCTKGTEWQAVFQDCCWFLSSSRSLVLQSPTPPQASASASSDGWNTYVKVMSHTPTVPGCYESTYPNELWISTPCGVPPSIPMTVGNGYDWSASSGSTTLGYAIGSFPSVNGLTSESDTYWGSNYYSMQVNSNQFSCTYGGKSTTCWEQFLMDNNAANNGFIWIQYWLIGYYSSYGSCPSSWSQYNGSCYTNSPSGKTIPQGYPPPSALAQLSMSGSSNLSGSGNDQVTLCVQGTGCYSYSTSDSVFYLYQSWGLAEFNILGYGAGANGPTQAQFNSGAAITINDQEETTSGASVTPSCSNTGTTGETNNLLLYSCSVSGNTMSFSERLQYYLTMQISGCCGSVSPSSGWYSAGSTVQISATPSPGCNSFISWTGSGTGSYTGSNNPASITMNSAITETANFKPLCAPSG